MTDKIAGELLIGIIESRGEVSIHIPPDSIAGMRLEQGTGGHLDFSPKQARNLARILLRKADEIEKVTTVVCTDSASNRERLGWKGEPPAPLTLRGVSAEQAQCRA